MPRPRIITMAVQDVLKEEFLILAGISGMLMVAQVLMSLLGSFFLNLVLFAVAVSTSVYYAEIVQHTEVNRSAILSARIGYDIVGFVLGFFAYVLAVLLLSASSNFSPSDIMETVAQSKTISRFIICCIYLYCADYTLLAFSRFVCNIVRLITTLITND